MLASLNKIILSFKTVILFFVLSAQSITAYANEGEKSGFDLWELRVKGNTLLERSEIERTVYPFLGPKKSIDVVEQARSTLENLFQMQG